MLERLRQSTPFVWFRRTKSGPRDEADAGGAQRVYHPNRTTPPILVVTLCLIVAVPVAGALLVSSQTSDDMTTVLAVVFGMIAFLDLILILLVRLVPFVFPHPLNELRIQGRVITVRHRWNERSFWLGDATRLVWVQTDPPVRVYLVSDELEFMIPLTTLKRADSVELFEWLRWGSPVGDEYWPAFCHQVALPRRGPIDRPLRECERLRIRKRWDRLVAEAATAMAIASGCVAAWTGEFRWLAILWMVPALWMWRFTIPREGQIVVRAPLCPKAKRYALGLMALLAGLPLSVPFALGEKGELSTAYGGLLTIVLSFAAVAVAAGLYGEQKQFAAQQTPGWIERAVIAWNAEAKSGAWALAREGRQAVGVMGARDS